MRTVDFLLNGRRADPIGSAISSGGASVATNYWTSLENSATNAWNVNFSSGNLNNNNKYNTNQVRALAALDEKYLTSWVEAFEDCCTHKLSSEQCTEYRLRVHDLMLVAAEVATRTYYPTTSIRFYVTKPRLREVFAAAFRDRIAQHWVCIRLIPIIEERFLEVGDMSYNCRKEYGTLAAVKAYAEKIEKVSHGYARDAWILKLDIKSFFMTIDRKVLWSKLKPFILERYRGDDIDTLLWLTWTILRHEPQKDCVLRGPDLLPFLEKSKSLIYSDPFIGSPIGNITSQILANFLLTFMDEAVLEYMATHGGDGLRFMDDGMYVFDTKESALGLRDFLLEWMPANLHQEIHPKKIYLQEAHHGVKALGYVIKPGRIYIANETRGRMVDSIRSIERLCKLIVASDEPTVRQLLALEHFVAGLNSHFGFLTHAAARNVILQAFSGLEYFWKVCYIVNLHVVRIRKKYQLKTLLIKKENDYIDNPPGEGHLLPEPLPPALPHHRDRHLRRPGRLHL